MVRWNPRFRNLSPSLLRTYKHWSSCSSWAPHGYAVYLHSLAHEIRVLCLVLLFMTITRSSASWWMRPQLKRLRYNIFCEVDREICRQWLIGISPYMYYRVAHLWATIRLDHTSYELNPRTTNNQILKTTNLDQQALHFTNRSTFMEALTKSKLS